MPWKHPRPEQVAPAWDWLVWFILAGRGWGKTRTGAEWLKDRARHLPDTRWFIAAPTYADCRDTCVEGVSGLIRVMPPSALIDGSVERSYNRSLGEITLANQSKIKMFSGDEPDRFRGPQHHGGWFDELGAFRYPRDAWDQAMFGLRLGDRPQVVVTTTPKPIELIRELMDDPNVAITRGSTFDNAANLAATALEQLKKKYEGTRLGRQELYGELLTDVPGAIATFEQLDRGRIQAGGYLPDFARRVCSVDPAVTNTDDSDATGISVLGRAGDDVFQLDDCSLKADVEEWAMLAITTAVKWLCGTLLYEANQGGDSIGIVLRDALRKFNQQERKNHPLDVRPVTARQSKWDRALPLQLAIQQGRFHLVGSHPQLENELTTWVPIDERGKKVESPNSLDACVHGFRHLMDMDPVATTAYQRTGIPGRR